jgi:hypothetical protein
MISINPQVVRVPDGRVGCLVARIGMQGCVEFGKQRILETYSLAVLGYTYWQAGNSGTKRR